MYGQGRPCNKGCEMSENEQAFLWNEMFQKLRDSGATAAVFLKNGIRLIGKVLKFDKEAVLMTSPTSTVGLTVARDSIATAGEFSQNQSRQETPPMKR